MGFDVVLDGGIKRLVPNTAKMKMIAHVHQLRTSDPMVTLRAISATLVEEGHITSKSKPYSASQIARILARGNITPEISGSE